MFSFFECKPKRNVFFLYFVDLIRIWSLSKFEWAQIVVKQKRQLKKPKQNAHQIVQQITWTERKNILWKTKTHSQKKTSTDKSQVNCSHANFSSLTHIQLKGNICSFFSFAQLWNIFQLKFMEIGVILEYPLCAVLCWHFVWSWRFRHRILSGTANLIWTIFQILILSVRSSSNYFCLIIIIMFFSIFNMIFSSSIRSFPIQNDEVDGFHHSSTVKKLIEIRWKQSWANFRLYRLFWGAGQWPSLNFLAEKLWKSYGNIYVV